MASRSLGSLTLDLLVKTGAFVSGMTAAERAAQKSLTAIEKRALAFGQTLGRGIRVGATLATAALGALSIAVGKAINDADQIRDLSIRLGTSTETLSAFGYAAQQTGTDLDALGQGMKILARNATDAQKATSEQAAIFAALGISVTDAEGKLKNLGDLIPEVATAFQGMEDGTQKTALALALFGKSGTELIEFLNQGEDGLAAFTDKARELGIVIDSETAKAADDFNDILGDLKAVISGGALTIAKEMLPALKQAATELARFAQEGDLAKNVAGALSGALQIGVGILDTYNNAVARTTIAMEFFSKAGEAMRAAATGGLLGQLSAIQQVNGALKDGQAELDALIKRQNAPSFAGVSSRILGRDPVSNVNTAALNKALSSDFKTPKSKTGKTDAERAAERLAKAIRQMTNEQREWQTELDGTGNQVMDNYAERLDEITEKAAKFTEDGIPTEKIKAYKEEMTKLADALKSKELVEFSKDFAEETAQIGLAIDGVASPALLKYQRDVRDLDKVLKSGAITQQEYTDRLKALKDERNSESINIQKNLEFETSLLGKTADEQERLTLARQLGTDAATEQGQAALKALEDFQKASELQEFIDDTKEGLGNMFVDFISGAKTAKEAFGDFADDLFKRALQFVADKAIQALFDSFGGAAGGASGGSATGWAGFFQNLMGAFGGGKAAGGPVKPWSMYEVNESGMEGLTVGGRDYLMTGAQGGMVTPAHKLGGSVNQSNTFYLSSPERQQTQQQIASRVAFETSQVTRRNK